MLWISPIFNDLFLRCILPIKNDFVKIWIDRERVRQPNRVTRCECFGLFICSCHFLAYALLMLLLSFFRSLSIDQPLLIWLNSFGFFFVRLFELQQKWKFTVMNPFNELVYCCGFNRVIDDRNSVKIYNFQFNLEFLLFD